MEEMWSTVHNAECQPLNMEMSVTFVHYRDVRWQQWLGLTWLTLYSSSPYSVADTQQRGIYDSSVRSMNIDVQPHTFGKFPTAISLRRVTRPTSEFTIGWSFRGRQIERCYMRANQIHFENFKWCCYLCNASSDTLHIWF